jgi:hypothetical protein
MLTGSVSFEPADTSNPIFRRYTGCMALSVRVSGLDAYGVELFSPTRPEFDEFARPLLGERIANVGLRLKPMLAIVSNENVRTIVSLSLIWHVIHRDGTTGRYWSHTSFPDVICGDVSHDPAGLQTGQRRIEAYGLVIHGWSQWDEYFDQFLGQFVEQKDALLADAVDLHIELNAVIFADGTLIGADDESALRDLFCMCRQNRTGTAASSRRLMLVSQWPTRSHQSSDSWPTRPIGCVLGTSWGRSRAICGHVRRPPKRRAGTAATRTKIFGRY